jgi:hypothetical protein
MSVAPAAADGITLRLTLSVGADVAGPTVPSWHPTASAKPLAASDRTVRA